jgi:hypothetical protein
MLIHIFAGIVFILAVVFAYRSGYNEGVDDCKHDWEEFDLAEAIKDDIANNTQEP